MMEPETPRVGQKKELRKANQFSMRKALSDGHNKNSEHVTMDQEIELDGYNDPSTHSPLAPIQDEEELLSNDDRAQVELIEKARHIESLDYEIYENAVYRGKQTSRTVSERRTYLLLRWLYPVLIGSLTGLTAFIINLCVENIAGYKFQTTIHLNESSTVMAFLVYCMFDVALTMIATFLTTFVSPPAAGSGIPDVKIYLNGVNLPGALLFSTLFTKVIGAICAIAGGLAVGKEGPTVHVGSCISAMLGQGGCKWYKLPAKWLKMFQNDRDRRDLITIGAACGVAAAFKAPVGGVLFVIEEASSWMRPKLLWRCFFGTAVVHIVLRGLRTWCEDGGCGKFGKGGFIIFNIKEGQFDYSPWEVFPVCLIGIIGGLLGTLFIRINTAICVWRRTHQKGWRKVWNPLLLLPPPLLNL